jgi:hypothetical protein
MSPDRVLELALAAASKGVKELYPGQARWLPLMLRIAPGYTEALVARS